ncbi:hypothetical protein GR160_14055 [Flavobacterium sp. Sd200]|uniref:sensor histidine kinase n=1 Tax=Flavobacterium sp. Sd200 TaxID=2692211 RepID=UPI00136C111A|nr:sensor histidine kinase [Flavobacterium sp. Sd200]MXN92348.1 hypothetical protein [Flavobacterium sp. Sd200]
MKLLYHFFSCLFLLTGYNLWGQHTSFTKEIKVIDSLIRYDHFEKALLKTKVLYNNLEKADNEKYKTELLELQFREAVIYDENENSSVEPLKILLKIIDEAEKENLHSLCCRIYLMIALAYEKSNHLELTDKYLNKAFSKYKVHNLKELYSTYCIRRSSYYRIINKLDSLNYFALQAEKYATRFNNERDLLDAYLLIGAYASKSKDYQKSLEYGLRILKYKKQQNQYHEIMFQYNNVSFKYLKMQNYTEALKYNDSAYIFQKKFNSQNEEYLPQIRYQIYEGLGNTDSAYYYFKQYHDNLQLLLAHEEKLKIKRIEKQYESDKNEATIKDKDRQMILIASLLAVIILASILLLGKNKQINHRNRIINQQLGELTKLLEQKQVLLSELQHRVKNNLQHVISILEIQKESADFNNIDELIRGNQNRIHSMALLHKKLNLTDNVKDIDLKKYITELSEVVIESYDNHKKKINININCEIQKISIEKALPIGLILVELISNSIKHAFKKRSIGIINIELTKTHNANKIYYSDNGDGFDFNKTTDKGLGLEITKGLIDQIDGTIEAKTDRGFELIIYFK